MSRCAVDVVGRRGLQLATLSPPPRLGRTASTILSRPWVAISPAESPRSLSYQRRALATSSHNAAATVTSFSKPSSAAPEITIAGWRNAFHTPAFVRRGPSEALIRCVVLRRWKSDRTRLPESRSGADSAKLAGDSSVGNTTRASRPEATASGEEHASKSIYERLPHLHRPSKEELLSAATGFWHRLQIRFKWFSIRSVRPFNHDEIFAFLSWIFWGHVLWFVIGTTTFVSLMIWALNTVFAQETLAGWIGNYLTRSSGVKVVFESAVVPGWRDGVISFNKVFVSRRPATAKSSRSVTKGSPEAAALAAAAGGLTEKETSSASPTMASAAEQEDDGNYAQFDVTIENVEVTLSFAKWFNGKGLLRDVSVSGVRGVLDRTSVQPRAGDEDPKSYRHEHNTGDFEIDNFKMQDVLLTVYQPNGFRPFQVSVHSCELPRLRKQWLFYDFLCANTAHGSFDNSLFTIHPRQVHGSTGVTLVEGKEEEASQWKKHSRLRIDGLTIDHLNRGVEGPFSWIHEGNVDIVADVMIPDDADGSIAKVMSDFYDRMEATVTSQTQPGRAVAQDAQGQIINNKSLIQDGAPEESPAQQSEPNPNDNRFLVMDIQIHLNDVRATVPIFTRDISYVNNAVVRPIVAYINSHSHGSKNYIPISCRIVKRLSEFDGSWTMFDSGLLDDLSRETYEAFVRDIMDRKQRQRRIKKVGLWAAQVAAQALFIGLAGQLA